MKKTLSEALIERAEWAQARADLNERKNNEWAEAGNARMARVAWESYMECIAERDAYLEAAKMARATNE